MVFRSTTHQAIAVCDTSAMYADGKHNKNGKSLVSDESTLHDVYWGIIEQLPIINGIGVDRFVVLMSAYTRDEYQIAGASFLSYNSQYIGFVTVNRSVLDSYGKQIDGIGLNAIDFMNDRVIRVI